ISFAALLGQDLLNWVMATSRTERQVADTPRLRQSRLRCLCRCSAATESCRATTAIFHRRSTTATAMRSRDGYPLRHDRPDDDAPNISSTFAQMAICGGIAYVL